MFSLGLSVVGAVKKNRKEGEKDNQGVKLLQSAGFWEKKKMQFDNPYVLLYRSRLSGSKCGISPKIYFHLPSLESVMCVQWRHVNLSVPYLPLVSVHTSFCSVAVSFCRRDLWRVQAVCKHHSLNSNVRAVGWRNQVPKVPCYNLTWDQHCLNGLCVRKALSWLASVHRVVAFKNFFSGLNAKKTEGEKEERPVVCFPCCLWALCLFIFPLGLNVGQWYIITLHGRENISQALVFKLSKHVFATAYVCKCMCVWKLFMCVCVCVHVWMHYICFPNCLPFLAVCSLSCLERYLMS